MKNKFIKIFLLFILLFSSKLAAQEIVFNCEYANIPFKATRTYICDFNGRLKYQIPMGHEFDILENSPFLSSIENLKISKNIASRSANDIYGNNFYDFDVNGNLHFTGTLFYRIFNQPDSNLDYSEFQNIVVIYKFDPVNLSLEYQLLNPNSTVHNFCISKNGKWVFVDIFENSDEKYGTPVVYAVSTDFKSNSEEIYTTSNRSKLLESKVYGNVL